MLASDLGDSDCTEGEVSSVTGSGVDTVEIDAANVISCIVIFLTPLKFRNNHFKMSLPSLYILNVCIPWSEQNDHGGLFGKILRLTAALLIIPYVHNLSKKKRYSDGR